MEMISTDIFAEKESKKKKIVEIHSYIKSVLKYYFQDQQIKLPILRRFMKTSN